MIFLKSASFTFRRVLVVRLHFLTCCDPLGFDEGSFERLGRALLHVVLAFGLHNLKDQNPSDPWLRPPPSSVAIKQERYMVKQTSRALSNVASTNASPEEQKQARQAAICERMWTLFIDAHVCHDTSSMNERLPIEVSSVSTDDFQPPEPPAMPSHVDGKARQRPRAGMNHTVLRALHIWLKRADPELVKQLKLPEKRLNPLKEALRAMFKWAKEAADEGDAEAINWPGDHACLVFNPEKTRRKVNGCDKEHADVLFNWSPKYDQQSFIPA